MKAILFLIFSMPTLILSQQRIGLDVSYKLGLNTTLSYHKVFSENWLISGALTYGRKGRYESDYRDYPSDYSGFKSPWSELNELIIENNSTYSLIHYKVRSKAISFQLGLGYFHNFNVKHGVRGHLFLQYGQAFNEVRAYYDAPDQNYLEERWKTIQNPLAAVSFEIYHTIHLWKKYTLYYGLKTPYYFQVDRNQYNPTRKDDLFNGLEPEISIGVTYLIGDCK